MIELMENNNKQLGDQMEPPAPFELARSGKTQVAPSVQLSSRLKSIVQTLIAKKKGESEWLCKASLLV